MLKGENHKAPQARPRDFCDADRHPRASCAQGAVFFHLVSMRADHPVASPHTQLFGGR